MEAPNTGTMPPPSPPPSTNFACLTNFEFKVIAKVRFRPEPGSRRRTATKPVQDEPIWEGSKLFKTLYN